jgi:signal transduction histidine kinase
MPNANRLRFQIEVEQPVNFVSDVFRVTTILKNLISNAIKYQNVHNQESYSRFSIKVSGKEAVIDVGDNGIGIKEEQKERIFEMFYRGTQEGAGSGLGLYITKLNIEKLQGTVTLESKYGEGTRFVICLPNHLIYEDAVKRSEPVKS